MTSTKYVLVYVALLGLTGLTFGCSFLSLGPWEWPVALGIALVKGVLVGLFFMHLSESSAAHRLALLVAVVLLSILVLFAMADVWTKTDRSSASVNARVRRADHDIGAPPNAQGARTTASML